METETPQTQIASFLAKSLRERSLDAIGRSWEHQEPYIYKAKAGLTELSDILQFIQDLHIYDQHKQISNDCLDDWLWRFKDFFYKTENVLDNLDFIKFYSRDWRQDNDDPTRDVIPFMKAIEKLPKVIKTANDLFIEIEHFEKELQKSKPVCSSLDQQINTSSGLRTLPSKVRELKGRAVEKAKILEALLHKADGESKEPPVTISITGPVGIGKTELARAVYNSAQVEAEFDVRAWIYMGNHHLGEWWLTLQRSVSPSVYKQSKIHRTSGSSRGDSILETMKTEIKGKKVLIILDNLTEQFCDDLFEYGAKAGSRIIVTSQLRYVGNSDGLLFNVELDGLEEEEYLELFKECAFGDRYRNKYPELEDIVGEIAKRFGGNPLAAVMIGRHLKWHQSEERWRMISRSNLGMIDPTESNLLSQLLRRSYEQLPVNMKLCYLACALFPKNFPFKKNQLSEIWDAIGFGSHASSLSSWTWKNIESFFVSSARKDGEFVLHATLHELADYICDGEFFRLEDEIVCDGEFFRLEDEIEEEDGVAIPHKAQHVYVTADNFVKVWLVLQKKTHLRSLVIGGILSSEERKAIFMELLEVVLLNLKDLRLLMISVLPTGKLPDAIRHLRHLRHLELPGESIQEFPTWLSNDRFDGLRGVRLLRAIKIALLKSPSAVQELPTQKSTESKAILQNPSLVQELPTQKSTESKAILQNPSSVQELPTQKSTESTARLKNPSSVQQLPARKFSRGDIKKSIIKSWQLGNRRNQKQDGVSSFQD